MTELMKQVRSLFSCGGLVPVLSGCSGIIFRFYSRKYLKETRNVILFSSYFSTSIKTCISFLVFFHLSTKSKPHNFIHCYIFLRIFSLIFLYKPLNTNFQTYSFIRLIYLMFLCFSTVSHSFCVFPTGLGSVSFLLHSFFLPGQNK